MSKKIILAGLLLTLFFILSSAPLTAQAALIDPSNSSYEYGSYSLNDIMGIVIGASNWVLGIVGSLALLMFIYGGFMFLISAGSSDKIGQAQKILVAAVIGLIIVFASYMIIRFVSQAIGVDWQGGKIIPSSSATKTTTSSGTTAIPTDCVEKYGADFSCRSASDAGYCIANHCGNGAEVCCHTSCAEQLGTQGYSCRDYKYDPTENLDCQNNLCPSEAGKNMKCCKQL